MKKIYIVHENSQWTEPLIEHLKALGLPYEDWFLKEGVLDLTEEPPKGIFYNRMSASSHTRGHRYAPEYTGAVLEWLESHGRRVINNRRALQLEVSRIAQYSELKKFDIQTPKTIAAIGREHLIEAAKKFKGPFVIKHNRAGKGIGVQLFSDTKSLKRYIEGPEFEEPVDGITLIQEYIKAPGQFITRCEFVGGKFIYAVKVDTSLGFELFTADICQISDGYFPIGGTKPLKFKIIKNFNNPIIEKYEKFLQANEIDIAGIEFITDIYNNVFTYYVNTSTNYNPEAEILAGVSGMMEIAEYLGSELGKIK